METHQPHSSATAAQRIATSLERHNVEIVFGQSLPSALILACEDIGIRQIAYRTENAAGAMADGFARVSGKVGVVTAQNGPAATLLVPPLAEAMKASVPVIALVQDINRYQVDRNAFQELDHLELFRSCTKWVRHVSDASRVEEYVDNAFTIAASGRPGPAALLLPADMLNDVPPPSPFSRTQTLGYWPIDRVVADPTAISEAATLLAAAARPLVVAGGGVHGSDAVPELVALQERYCLPVAHTMMGKGVVDDGHPLTVGLIGNVMGKYSLGKHTRALVENADLIFFVGTRTNQNGTDSWSLFPAAAKMIHLDIATEEVGRTYESCRLVGDAKVTLQALLEELATRPRYEWISHRNAVEGLIRNARIRRQEETQALTRSSASPIRPETVMSALQSVMTPETIVVADASYSSVWITSYLRTLRAGQRFLTPRGLAGLGWGYPLALGAKLAMPCSPVVCVVGDGGFGHCWAELETAARMRIPVTVIVLNNSVLGFQKDAETIKFGRHTSACHFAAVDHAGIARSCGITAHRVENPDQLPQLLASAIDSPVPILLDVVTEPAAYPPITMFDDGLDQ